MKKKWLLLESNKKQMENLREFIETRIPQAELTCADNLKDAYTLIFEQTFDLLIVNPILDEKDSADIAGIYFVRNVRDIIRYIFTPVIYITPLTDHDFSVYKDPNCMGYFRLPYKDADLQQVFEDALEFTTPKKNREVLYVRGKERLYSILVEDILYVEYVDGVAEIHTVNRAVERVEGALCKQSVAEMESMNLIQCGKNLFVNSFFVNEIDKKRKVLIIRGDGLELPIGSSFMKDVSDYMKNR